MRTAAAMVLALLAAATAFADGGRRGGGDGPEGGGGDGREAASSGATEKPLGLGDLAAAAQSGNIDLMKDRQTLEEARIDLAGTSLLLESVLSVSGDYTRLLSGSQKDTATGSATLTIPLLPQLKVGAVVSAEGSAGATVTVSPFAAGTTTYAEKAAWRTAQLNLDYDTRKVAFDVEAAALALLAAEEDRAVKRDAVDLEERITAVSRKTYEMGEITFDELQDDLEDLYTARQEDFDAQKTLLSARVTLQSLLAPSETEAAVRAVTVEELEGFIAARDGKLAETASRTPATLALRTAEIGLDELREQLEATPLYRPSLSLGGQVSASLTGGSLPSATGSLSMDFSPSDIKTDDRASIRRSIAYKQAAVELERINASYQARILTRALEVARQELEGRRSDLRQAERTVAETGVLVENGEDTAFDLEQAGLDLRTARGKLFTALASVLAAQAAILLASSL